MVNNYLLSYLKKLSLKVPLENIFIFGNEMFCVCSAKNLKFVIFFLSHFSYCQFKILSYITAVDYPEKKNRFEVVYDFLSISFNTRIRVKVFLNEVSILPSICSLYNSAN